MKKLIYIIILSFFCCNITFADYLTNLKTKADAGDPMAQNNLGHIYLYGNEELNVEIDQEKGIDYGNN